MVHSVIKFFDKLEDEIRAALSRQPIVYAFIGGVGIILFWKGVWETAGYFPALFGPASILIGIIILLLTGLLVSFFIGDSIILSGYKHEKKLVEKTEGEVRAEQTEMEVVLAKLDRIEKLLHAFKQKRAVTSKTKSL